MHVHFEQNTCTRTESTFLSLSWMGKVPEDLPEAGGGWKLNRAQYYVEGWLASGNTRGIVGVTFSTSHCHRHDAPPRSNFNLRGHRSEVMLVRWNEPYQKLATCDIRGVIFVWTKHEGRWSIELINDRSSQVTDFAWSHDGRMALICYRDGFILVGSVAGQRYWSSMLHLDNTTITCGLWSPDDQQVMFGTLDGQIVVMSSTGSVVTQLSIHEGHEITGMAWSCERFNMEEAETSRDQGDGASDSSLPKQHVLAVSFKYGEIFLMTGYDDPSPITIYTALTDVKMDWSNCGEYLAVGGFVRQANLECRNEVRFYAKDGTMVHWVPIPSQGKPLSAMTWGHNDKRLFVAAGCHMYVAWVSKQVAPLNFLCQRIIHKSVKSYKAVEKLPIPQRLKCGVKALFSPTIKSYIPEPLHLREFVCWPPPGGERLFCTMVRHGEETSGGHYTLYLEYLGGLVPLLKGKRASKLRPDFIIFDPKIKSSGKAGDQNQQGNTIESDSSSESDAGVITDGCGSPRMQRRRRHKVFRAEKVNRSITFRTLDELMFDDNLPENNRLVEVTSNIWGTKFQITGVGSCLPACLGQIVYKTSLLHLQPRQMTITIAEISPSRPLLSRDPNFTPAPISDDEDSFWTNDGEYSGERTVEVAVHDVPAGVIYYGRDISAITKNGGDAIISNGNSTGSTPLVENHSEINGNGKHSNSGSVRLRSLSPARNSLTHSTPVHNQDAQTGSNNRQESNTTAWQGARPKTNLTHGSGNSNNNSNINNNGASGPNSPKSNNTNNRCHSNNSSTTTCSPKLGHVGNYKCAAMSTSNANTNSSLSNSNNIPVANHQYASTNGVISTPPPCSNRVDTYPFISTANNNSTNSSRSKKIELIGGFKRLELNCTVDKRGGGVGGGGNGGGGGDHLTTVSSAWKQESPPDASKESSDDEMSMSVKAGAFISDTLVSPVRPTIDSTPIALRWADPAAQSVKLVDEDGVDVAELPFESNLVADCSPTAPLSLDLQRRLYLAHQHIIETGAPISPTNCPSCLPPAMRSALSNPNSVSGSNDVTCDVTHPNSHRNVSHGAPHNNAFTTKNQSINAVSKGDVSSENEHNKTVYCRLPSSRNACNSKSASDICSHSVSNQSETSNTRLTGTTKSDNGATTSSSSLLLPRSPSSSLTSSSSLSSSSSSRNSSKEEIVYSCHSKDISNNAPTPLPISTATITRPSTSTSITHPQPPSSSSPSPTQSKRIKFHGSTSSIPGRSFFQTSTPITTPTTNNPISAAPSPFDHSNSKTRQPPSSSSGRPFPSDRTSSEKLAHLLSEDPQYQNSTHNIQSMPGFVMKNPNNPQYKSAAEREDSLHSSPEKSSSNSENGYTQQDNLNISFYKYGASPENSFEIGNDAVHYIDIHQISASLPTSPIRFGMKKDQGNGVGLENEKFINGKCKHLSPLLHRRGRNGQTQENHMYQSMDIPQGYHSLEAFQKAQLRQKMRRKSMGPHSRFDQGRTFIMHNKAPLWNETSQVYQLDFGGRVTQESAKNFQIELRGKQVMQFGRIDNNAYTLDFQYPFTAVQAFAVALANVTQRLK